MKFPCNQFQENFCENDFTVKFVFDLIFYLLVSHIEVDMYVAFGQCVICLKLITIF